MKLTKLCAVHNHLHSNFWKYEPKTRFLGMFTICISELQKNRFKQHLQLLFQCCPKCAKSLSFPCTPILSYKRKQHFYTHQRGLKDQYAQLNCSPQHRGFQSCTSKPVFHFFHFNHTENKEYQQCLSPVCLSQKQTNTNKRMFNLWPKYQ